ncbi:MAG: membrane protein insertion efficiency factor YidD [Deltaproteobacteria bacterium]|nr:membrane protein insertion efficiency factor YidD [Deltaproteobacteria bacterium]
MPAPARTAWRFCQRLLLCFVRFYQIAISPLLPPACRFQPTCSVYAAQAIRWYGPWKGSWMALRRLARCHPFHPGGHDPVPGPEEHS